MLKLQNLVNKLYHADLGFPKDVVLPKGQIVLDYGGHAKEEAIKDRYGVAVLPRVLDFSKAKIFEIEVNPAKKVVKVGCRVHYDDKKDLIVVVIPQTRFVKTVWFNLKSDTHKTLDPTKYAFPD